jgi:hypothetical protein
MSKMQQPIKMLGGEAQEEFNAFQKKTAIASKGRTADKEAKRLKQAIVDRMGEFNLAQLPDGRILQRVRKEMHQPARKASDYEWWELAELPDEVHQQIRPVARKKAG